MCGFTGILSPRAADHDEALVARMNAAIRHRGPDSDGVWRDAEAGISLGHLRLAIIDLSPAGHQPMLSAGGRFVIAFNGEIYNHLELRAELESAGRNPAWCGHSDTETLLAAIEAWGLEETLKKTTGMFALALWDRQRRTLSLARDRIGEKPLYYGRQNGTLLFGSELAALKAHPAFRGEIDRDALTLLMRHNYIPAPYSIYKGVRKLPPATFVTFAADQLAMGHDLPAPQSYWHFQQVAETGVDAPFAGTDEEAVDALDRVLSQAISQQMMADVPLGAFLSGGIDSSTIVALMQKQSERPVKTFTIGFDEKDYNEAEHAKAVARHLGTEHTELYVSPDQALDLIPRLPTLYSEPFSDASQMPTFLVSQMTRQHVTVSLSGDAGDELFGGYNRYFWVNRIWDMVRRLPQPFWRAAAGAMRLPSPALLNSLAGAVGTVVPQARVSLPGDKAHKLAGILASGSQENIFYGLTSHTAQPARMIVGATEPETVLTRREAWPRFADFEHQMMYLDTLSYLPDDILVKVDRAAMGVALETRVPFLDHHVVEFAWRLPLHMKVRDGQGKWILRQLLDRYVPRPLIERPKMGFAIPIDSWLRGPLQDWAEALLDESRLRQEGYFNAAPIRQKWREHLSGQRNWQYYLWNVLMFQAWLEQQK